VAAPSRRSLLAGLGAASLSACATATAPIRAQFVTPRLVPLQLRADRITRITCCLRPFRPQGPRLDVESVAGKRVVHNYGHGGSGWSLAWGSGAIATRNAMAGGAKSVAVIGAGALGLTSAILLQRAGAKVTIYAKDRPQDTRSFRATGLWSPDSRIADADRIDASFPALWAEMAKTSWAMHQTYLGMPGEPVSFTDRYILRDALPAPHARAPNEIRFFAAHVEGVPRSRELAPGEHPFPVARARVATTMQFNVSELMHRLTEDFLLEGGAIVPMTFETPGDMARLAEPVVVNCTGYGARALWKDESIAPVRGQIAWLAAQPEARYGLIYRGVSVLARPDGVVVQQVGDSDMFGMGLDNETPDRAETDAALATVAGLFA
jgi:glycine/D-amino acid oxidase-like deaminating enzyme